MEVGSTRKVLNLKKGFREVLTARHWLRNIALDQVVRLDLKLVELLS